jgi:hypothetical protein
MQWLWFTQNEDNPFIKRALLSHTIILTLLNTSCRYVKYWMNKLFKFQNCAFSYSSTKAPIITNMKSYTVIEYIFMTTEINFDCN